MFYKGLLHTDSQVLTEYAVKHAARRSHAAHRRHACGPHKLSSFFPPLIGRGLVRFGEVEVGGDNFQSSQVLYKNNKTFKLNNDLVLMFFFVLYGYA